MGRFETKDSEVGKRGAGGEGDLSTEGGDEAPDVLENGRTSSGLLGCPIAAWGQHGILREKERESA